jgi:hypothetical protein
MTVDSHAIQLISHKTHAANLKLQSVKSIELRPHLRLKAGWLAQLLLQLQPLSSQWHCWHLLLEIIQPMQLLMLPGLQWQQ